MHTITSRNVNQAFVDGRWWLKTAGIREMTRNGEVLVAPGPVCTVYKQPWERVLFDATRDCNPFFHLFESIWMFSGEQQVRPLLKFNKRMQEFAEPDGRIHGAYGYRWRRSYNFDQLKGVIGKLRDESSTRQAVLTMWHPEDLLVNTKDRPCNTHCYFMLRRNMLTMTVLCRSNDMVWGAYGANAVHFSMLHEFIANAVGIPMGAMYQFSNNFHIYTNVPNYEELMAHPYLEVDPYESLGPTGVFPSQELVTPGNWLQFLSECQNLMYSFGEPQISNSFLKEIVVPMIKLWDTRDMGILDTMPDCDWKEAFKQWLERRIEV